MQVVSLPPFLLPPLRGSLVHVAATSSNVRSTNGYNPPSETSLVIPYISLLSLNSVFYPLGIVARFVAMCQHRPGTEFGASVG